MSSIKHYELFKKIRTWAAARGIYEKGDPKTQLLKFYEEAGEISHALLREDIHEVKDAIGDSIVVLTNLAHLMGFTVEECIDQAYNEIANRKGKMIEGNFVKSDDLEQNQKGRILNG